MRKKVILVIGILVVASVLGLGVYHSNATQNEPQLTMEDIKQLVKNQYPGEITELELDKDFNKAVYEVEVLGDGKEYDLKLDANSGEVLNIKEKLIDNNKVANDTKKQITINEKQAKEENKNKSDEEKSKSTKEEQKKTVIDINEATELALKEFSGQVTDVDLDEEDGRLIYEIEIKANEQEAEIEIDAYTGEILVMEIDSDND